MNMDKEYHKIMVSMENRITQLESVVTNGCNTNFDKLFERMQLLEDFVRIDGEWENVRSTLRETGKDNMDILKAFIDKSMEREIARMKVTGEI